MLLLFPKFTLKNYCVAYLEKRLEPGAPNWVGSSAFSPTTITTAQLAPHAQKPEQIWDFCLMLNDMRLFTRYLTRSACRCFVILSKQCNWKTLCSFFFPILRNCMKDVLTSQQFGGTFVLNFWVFDFERNVFPY